eukprot:TRINITY_DN4417_c0_g1_i12.p1 TRINITY_DN4417_c0_g1~~TRINITY_DN4417_c0_g1_i12.p1  ORF type:complete len:513 (-),score=66.02 TRINITY_DN4417_c0_g1_i12:29-1567(-)
MSTPAGRVLRSSATPTSAARGEQYVGLAPDLRGDDGGEFATPAATQKDLSDGAAGEDQPPTQGSDPPTFPWPSTASLDDWELYFNDVEKYLQDCKREMKLTKPNQLDVHADQLCWIRVISAQKQGGAPEFIAVIVWFHTMRNFLKGCVIRPYWYGFVHYMSVMLKRDRMDIKCKNFDTADELHFHLSEGIWLALFRAFQRSSYHHNLPADCPASAITAAFHRFLNAGRQQDMLFRYLSGYVLGAGQVYNAIRDAVRTDDCLLLRKLLPVLITCFSKSRQTNMRHMLFTFISMMMQLPCDEFNRVLANFTVSYSGRPYHNVATDMFLEFLNGLYKRIGGKQMSAATASRVSSMAHIYFQVNRNYRDMTGIDTRRTRWNQPAQQDIDPSRQDVSCIPTEWSVGGKVPPRYFNDWFTLHEGVGVTTTANVEEWRSLTMRMHLRLISVDTVSNLVLPWYVLGVELNYIATNGAVKPTCKHTRLLARGDSERCAVAPAVQIVVRLRAVILRWVWSKT